MRTGRWIALMLFLQVTGSAVSAGELDEQMAARWQGAWVLLDTEVYSDCLGCDSINRLGEGPVDSEGVRRFDPGELGRVREIEVGRQRIDLHIDLAEPLLVSSPRSGFVLYQERVCTVELRIEVPRDTVRERDTALLNAQLEAFVQPFADAESARSSPSWNQRLRGSYPDAYEETLASFERWREEWAGRATQTAWKVAYEALPRSGGDGYLERFAEGVHAVDAASWGTCQDLVDLPLPDALPTMSGASREGDGHAFAYALKLLARLRECELTERPEPMP